jgi:hypothetical protein
MSLTVLFLPTEALSLLELYSLAAKMAEDTVRGRHAASSHCRHLHSLQRKLLTVANCANVIPSSRILSAVMMEAISLSDL